MTAQLNLDIYRNKDRLGDFMSKVHRYPMLSAADEARFIKRWQKSKDPESGHRLVSSHLRLVVSIANGFRRYGLPVEDLISEGSVGLMQAVARFDQSRACRLSTYAKWWIRASIQEHIMRSWSLVRIGTTVAQKKLFFNLRRLKAELCTGDKAHLSEDDIQEIMTRLQIARHEVASMEVRLAGMDSSLNETVNDEDQSEKIDHLADNSDTPEEVFAGINLHSHQRRVLEEALTTVSPRDREIFVKRRLGDENPTLNDLGRDYGISPERVRQIEHGVFEKIKSYVLEEVPEGRRNLL